MVVLFSGLASCQQAAKQAAASSPAKKVAELEARESKWKQPDPKFVEEAKAHRFTGDAAKTVEKALQQDIPTAVLELQKAAKETQKAQVSLLSECEKVASKVHLIASRKS